MNRRFTTSGRLILDTFTARTRTCHAHAMAISTSPSSVGGGKRGKSCSVVSIAKEVFRIIGFLLCFVFLLCTHADYPLCAENSTL